MAHSGIGGTKGFGISGSRKAFLHLRLVLLVLVVLCLLLVCCVCNLYHVSPSVYFLWILGSIVLGRMKGIQFRLG